MHPAFGRPVHRTLRRVLVLLSVGLGLPLCLPEIAGAQPFGAWVVLNSTAGNYIDIPHSADLNPTGAITIEAWVALIPSSTGGQTCRSVIGKQYTQTYWVGVCGNTLRSYLKGLASLRDGGTVPTGQWTHVAVTFDGTNRVHYINGEQVASFPEAGPLPTNTSNVRIGSDTAWDFPPNGAIDEVRLWNVARSVDQIRSTINVPILAAMPGLVAVWGLDAGGNDAVGGHNGSVTGTSIGFLNFPVTLNCAPSTTALCLDGRISVTVSWRDFADNTGVGTVVPGAGPDSGVFWFFSPDNWEVLAKTINGCSYNNRRWAFAAGATNVFFRLEFTDVRAGANKIYFNYPGPPAVAVTDIGALATCP